MFPFLPVASVRGSGVVIVATYAGLFGHKWLGWFFDHVEDSIPQGWS